jgi:excisionase family DNA binding protein
VSRGDAERIVPTESPRARIAAMNGEVSGSEPVPVDRGQPEVPLHLKLALTPEQVEELTNVSARMVRDLVAKGLLRRVAHTSRILVPRSELDRWLKQRPSGTVRHPDRDCEDCGVTHVRWSMHQRDADRRQDDTPDALLFISQLDSLLETWRGALGRRTIAEILQQRAVTADHPASGSDEPR